MTCNYVSPTANLTVTHDDAPVTSRHHTHLFAEAVHLMLEGAVFAQDAGLLAGLFVGHFARVLELSGEGHLHLGELCDVLLRFLQLQTGQCAQA